MAHAVPPGTCKELRSGLRAIDRACVLGQALAGWGVRGWDPLASFHLLWAGALGSLGWDRLPAPQPHPGQPQRQPLEGFLCVTSLGITCPISCWTVPPRDRVPRP